MSRPVPRVSDRVAAAAAKTLVGREDEKRRLAALLTTDAAAVVFVHGPGGIGKTVLVEGVLAAMRLRSVVVDGHDTEPTVPGFLTALGAALGFAQVDVLVVERLERLNLLDGWLRNELAAGLPQDVKLVLVGRRGPNLAWRTSRGWRHLVAELALGPMTDGDVRALLAKRGVDEDTAEAIAGWTHGHPLAVDLSVEAWRRHPGLDPPTGATGEVVEELFAVLLADLDAEERAVVEAVTVLRRITRPGLAAVRGRGRPGLDTFVGIAERALELAVASGTSKTSIAIPGGTFSRHPHVQGQVADMHLTLDAARTLVDQVGVDWAAGVDHGPMMWGIKVLTAKWHAATAALRVVDLACDVVGGSSFRRGTELERLSRDVRAARFHPGTDAFTHEVIGKALLGLPSEGARW